MTTTTAADIVALFTARRPAGRDWQLLSPKQAAWLFGQARREGLVQTRERDHRYGRGAGATTRLSVARGTLADGTAWIASDGNRTLVTGPEAAEKDW